MGIFSGIGAIVSLGSTLFGGGDEGRGQGDGGKSEAISAFLRDDRDESNRFVDKIAARREASRQEQEQKTAEQLAVEAFRGDTRLTGANKQLQQAEWKNITDTMQNG